MCYLKPVYRKQHTLGTPEKKGKLFSLTDTLHDTQASIYNNNTIMG